MFDALREMVESVEPPGSPEDVLAVLAAIDTLTCVAARGIAGVEASGEWASSGAVSFTAWLRAAARPSGAEAARLVRTARSTRRLPVMTQAWADGRLSGSQVTAITAAISAATTGLLADQEAEVVPVLAELSVPQTARAMQYSQARAEAELGVEKPPPEEARELWLFPVGDGRWALKGTFDAEGGEMLLRAVQAAETKDLPGAPTRGGARRRADALVDVAAFTLAHQPRGTGRSKAQVNVIVGEDAARNRQPAWLGGSVVSCSVWERLLCDVVLRAVQTDGAHVLRYGKAVRSVPPVLFRAVALRDQGCRFPGCDRPAHWCDAHHVTPYPAGPTDIDNCALLCRVHHTLLHRPGWQAKLLPDATLEVTTPTGRTLTSRPPPTTPP